MTKHLLKISFPLSLHFPPTETMKKMKKTPNVKNSHWNGERHSQEHVFLQVWLTCKLSLVPSGIKEHLPPGLVQGTDIWIALSFQGVCVQNSSMEQLLKRLHVCYFCGLSERSLFKMFSFNDNVSLFLSLLFVSFMSVPPPQYHCFSLSCEVSCCSGAMGLGRCYGFV